MSSKMKWCILSLFILSSIFVVAGLGIDEESGLMSPITVNLSISKMPMVNESADLSFRIISVLDAPNTTAEIALPEGAKLEKGNLTAIFDLKANEPAYMNSTIVFSKTGDFTIKAIAHHVIDLNNSWGDYGALFLTIGQTVSEATPAKPWASYPTTQISLGHAEIAESNISAIPIDLKTLPPSNMIPAVAKDLAGRTYDQSMLPSSESAVDRSITPEGQDNISGSAMRISDEQVIASEGSNNTNIPGNPGTLTVTGYFYYWGQDAVFKTSPNAWLPAKHFYFRILRASDSAFLGDSYTNSDGSFSKTINNPGSAGFNIIWYTYTKWTDGEEMRVVDNEGAGLTGLNGVYNWHAGPYYAADGTFNIGSRGPYQSDDKARACWLLNDLDRANQYFSVYNGGDASSGTIAWWPTDPLDGAHYHHGGQIHLGAGYEYASHVVIHEYGHNLMWTLYENYLPPTGYNSHTWSQCYDDGLGWIEGWGDFFCCVPDNDPIYKDPAFSVDFESATWGNGWCYGPSCEGRVCGALWDIFDTVNDGYDTYSWGFGPIASVFTTGRQNTFADFWRQWNVKGYSYDAYWCLFQNTITLDASVVPDKLGNYKGNGVWALDYNGNGAWDGVGIDRVYVFGSPTDRPVVGDWNGDGKDELGNYKGNGVWALDYNGNGKWDGTSADRAYSFGSSTDQPVVGDWNGDGKDELGNYKGNGVWALDYNGNGKWDGTSTDRAYSFGSSTDQPVVGRWYLPL